jgi:hypothetical protein
MTLESVGARCWRNMEGREGSKKERREGKEDATARKVRSGGP